jgi:hypothetical protein
MLIAASPYSSLGLRLAATWIISAASQKEIIRAAGLRDELSFTSFRHGGFTEGADADMTDAELRARWPKPLRAPTAHIRQADAQTAHLSCSEKTRGEKKGRGLGRGLVKGTRDWLKATLSAPC